MTPRPPTKPAQPTIKSSRSRLLAPTVMRKANTLNKLQDIAAVLEENPLHADAKHWCTWTRGALRN
eukprot:6719797-Alexandrium_andersonii.AAC.1